MKLNSARFKFSLILESLIDYGYYKGSIGLFDENDPEIKSFAEFRYKETIGPIRNPNDIAKPTTYYQEMRLSIGVNEVYEAYFSIKTRIIPKGSANTNVKWGGERNFSTYEQFVKGLNDSIEGHASAFELSKKGIFELERSF